MKKKLVITELLILGILNFELTFSSHEFTQVFPPVLYMILAGLSVGIFIGLWWDYRRRNHFKWVEVLLLMMIAYPVISSVFSQSSFFIGFLNYNFADLEFVFSLSNLKEIQGIFYGASVGMMIYTLYMFTRRIHSVKDIYYLVMYAVIFFVTIEVIYSLITEWNEYVFVFNNFNSGARLGITSFTSNTNIYAFNLTMGVYAIGMLMMTEKKERMGLFVLGIIYLVALGFTISKTSLMSMVVYVVMYLFLFLVMMLKKHPIVKDLVLIAVCFVGVGVVYKIFEADSPFLMRIQHLLTTSTLSSFSSRVPIWMDGYRLIISENTLLGYGFGLSNSYLGVATAVPMRSIGTTMMHIINDRFHNGFLEILVSFGIIGSLLIIFGHSLYLKKLWSLSQKYWFTIPIWAMMISFVVQMMFEDRIMFRPDLSGLFFMTILILPIVHPKEFIATK
jgi:hypothetical protein